MYVPPVTGPTLPGTPGENDGSALGLGRGRRAPCDGGIAAVVLLGVADLESNVSSEASVGVVLVARPLLLGLTRLDQNLAARAVVRLAGLDRNSPGSAVVHRVLAADQDLA